MDCHRRRGNRHLSLKDKEPSHHRESMLCSEKRSDHPIDFIAGQHDIQKRVLGTGIAHLPIRFHARRRPVLKPGRGQDAILGPGQPSRQERPFRPFAKLGRHTTIVGLTPFQTGIFTRSIAVGTVSRVTPDTVARKPNAGSEANTAFRSPARHTRNRPGTPASSAAPHAKAARR